MAWSDINCSENWKLRLKTSPPCWECSVLWGWEGGLGHVKPKSRFGPPTGCAQVAFFRGIRHWAASCGQASVCHALPVPRRSPDSNRQRCAPLLIQWLIPYGGPITQSRDMFKAYTILYFRAGVHIENNHRVWWFLSIYFLFEDSVYRSLAWINAKGSSLDMTC